MPPILLFGHQWRTSSDDLVCPATFELSVRLVWVVIVTAVIIFHVQETWTLQCLGAEYGETTLYLSITLAILVLTCLNQVLLVQHSAKGSLCDEKPRRWVRSLLYINVFLTATEFLWTGMGTYFSIHDYISCQQDDQARPVIVAVLVVVCLSYLLIGMKVAVALLSWRPSAGAANTLNYRSLRCLMPCARKEGHVQAFRDIASLLGKILGEGSLVPSDVAAGLVLLAEKHRGSVKCRANVMEVEVDSAQPITSELRNNSLGAGALSMAPTGNETTGLPLEAWDRVCHYFQYASAAYGYWWYVMQAPCAHACSLGSYLNCCPSLCCLRREYDMVVRGDGICHCNTAAMQAMLGLKNEDILMFDNRNHIEEVPFFLVGDKRTDSLVVSIRGTLSLADMLTDLRGEPEFMKEVFSELNLADLNSVWKGHKGMCKAAAYVYGRLHFDEEDPSLLEHALQQTNYKKIVVTGHSLGAGTAAILTFLLRAKYPNLQVVCYAYSPPGGLLDAEASKESEKFCMSVVMGDDVIPRTSLHNIAALSQSIKHVCNNCQLPKYKVFGYGLLGCCGCCPQPRDNTLQQEATRLFSPPSPAGSRESEQTRSSDLALLESGKGDSATIEMEENDQRPGSPSHQFPEMWLPGRILHVTPRRFEIGLDEQENEFDVKEVNKCSFDEILISPRMLADHMPNYLDEVFRSTGPTHSLVPLEV
jgi:sn1-specific diacylglycerol lipase